MSDNVQPLVFLAGINRFGVDDGDWDLTAPGPDTDRRGFRARVAFEQAFRTVPVVHLGLVGFDISNEDSARLKVIPENINPSGFDVVVETWLNSRIWSIEVSWLAVGT